MDIVIVACIKIDMWLYVQITASKMMGFFYNFFIKCHTIQKNHVALIAFLNPKSLDENVNEKINLSYGIMTDYQVTWLTI